MTDIEPRFIWEMCKRRYLSLEGNLVRAAKAVGFYDDSRDGIGGGKPEYVPTEDEIREACCEIRRGWSLKEERDRRTHPNRRVPFVLRELAVR